MATESAALVADLRVRLDQFERDMRKAGDTADRAVKGIEDRFARSNPSIGSIAKGTFLGGLAIGAAEQGVRYLIDNVDKLTRGASDATNGFSALNPVMDRIATTIAGLTGDTADYNTALVTMLGLLGRVATAGGTAAESLGQLAKSGNEEAKRAFLRENLTYRGTPTLQGENVDKFYDAVLGRQPASGAADNSAVTKRDQYRGAIEDLRIEINLLSTSAEIRKTAQFTQDLDNAARRAGIDLTRELSAEDQQRLATLRGMVEQLDEQRKVYERVVEGARDAAQGAAHHFAAAFDEILVQGQSFAESMRQLLKSLSSDILRSLLTGQGSFGGLFGTSGQNGQAGGILGSLFSGLFLPKASGGYVSGPGSGTSDSILARLSNGEFVVNAQSTARFRGLLEAINSRAQQAFPALANGGFVSAFPGADIGAELVFQRVGRVI
ncbi:MAG: hypothetical protein HC900_07545 [Methylacidiphilales bacterium]|nr:hypothetical protein [Candidatus Methylacidiphilales bacterium]